jgi:hypothetical protein
MGSLRTVAEIARSAFGVLSYDVGYYINCSYGGSLYGLAEPIGIEEASEEAPKCFVRGEGRDFERGICLHVD